MFSCEYSKSFRDRILKKKVSGEIAFALTCFFHVQNTRAYKQISYKILQNLLNFIITKYLKQVVGNWRQKDLSMSHDEEVMMLLPPMEKCPEDLFLLPKQWPLCN